jgi:hypothetical protein
VEDLKSVFNTHLGTYLLRSTERRSLRAMGKKAAFQALADRRHSFEEGYGQFCKFLVRELFNPGFKLSHAHGSGPAGKDQLFHAVGGGFHCRLLSRTVGTLRRGSILPRIQI